MRNVRVITRKTSRQEDFSLVIAVRRIYSSQQKELGKPSKIQALVPFEGMN